MNYTPTDHKDKPGHTQCLKLNLAARHRKGGRIALMAYSDERSLTPRLSRSALPA